MFDDRQTRYEVEPPLGPSEGLRVIDRPDLDALAAKKLGKLVECTSVIAVLLGERHFESASSEREREGSEETAYVERRRASSLVVSVEKFDRADASPLG